jgi:hypothetical protein
MCQGGKASLQARSILQDLGFRVQGLGALPGEEGVAYSDKSLPTSEVRVHFSPIVAHVACCPNQWVRRLAAASLEIRL